MKKLLAVIMMLAVAAVAGVMLFPSQALRLEFARQRLLAGAEVQEKTVAGERWHYLEAGLDAQGFKGMEYNPFTKRYWLSQDTSVNYLFACRRMD